jgi:beta-glucanase (GH16 family)
MGKRQCILLGLMLGCSALSCARAEETTQWKLVWADEFDVAGAPDGEKWSFEQGFIRNREDQYYTDRPVNARVENGTLVIEAHKESVPNDRFSSGHKDWRRNRAESKYTSASLTTKGKTEWTYGRVEVRAKLPSGHGVWPAIWMLGANIKQVGWPNCGEIDIMEYVGFQPDRIHANVHMGKYNHVRGTGKGAGLDTQRPTDDFHLYRLDWYPERVEIYFDDQKFFTFNKESDDVAVWPFSKPHFLILNLAIGGTWGAKQGIDDQIFPQQYLIDYVRVFEMQ